MTFYDNDRIKRKNAKYTVKKAYDIVQQLESMGYKGAELVNELEFQLTEEVTEIQEEILKTAIKLVETSTEQEDNSEIKSFDYEDSRVLLKH